MLAGSRTCTALIWPSRRHNTLRSVFFFFFYFLFLKLRRCSSYISCFMVLAGSPSCGGDVTVYVPDINQPSLPAPFYSVLVSVSVFMTFSTVFHSINSPNNCPLTRSLLLILFCFIGPFNYNMFLYKSLSQP